MPDAKKEVVLTVGKIGTIIKTWLPIVIIVTAMVTGYVLFKSETQHQFELQALEQTTLAAAVKSLREDVDRNRREWRTSVTADLDNLDNRIDELEESRIRTLMRLKVLEGQPLGENDD